jgi:hypothetical protein
VYATLRASRQDLAAQVVRLGAHPGDWQIADDDPLDVRAWELPGGAGRYGFGMNDEVRCFPDGRLERLRPVLWRGARTLPDGTWLDGEHVVDMVPVGEDGAVDPIVLDGKPVGWD